MLNKKPIMLVLGCSWTDTNFLSVLKHLPDDRRGGWPMWDSYVQNKLEERDGIRYERINLASSGKSNQHIQRDFFRAVSMYGDRIKYVFVGGTKFNRYMGPHENASINIDTHNFFSSRKGAWAKIERWKGKKNLVLITHYVVISEMLNISTTSGEIVISDKNYNVIERLKISY